MFHSKVDLLLDEFETLKLKMYKKFIKMLPPIFTQSK